MRGIFDSSIIDHTPGDQFIFDVVRDFFVKNTPIEYHVEGRFKVIKESDSSASSLMMSVRMMILTIMFKLLLN